MIVSIYEPRVSQVKMMSRIHSPMQNSKYPDDVSIDAIVDDVVSHIDDTYLTTYTSFTASQAGKHCKVIDDAGNFSVVALGGFSSPRHLAIHCKIEEVLASFLRQDDRMLTG